MTGKRIGPRAAILLGFALAFVILALRTPDVFVMPQFWAEDGAVWYEDAHELGTWRPLIKTQDGYFSTYLRIVGALAQAFPLSAAPIFFALVAFAVQAAPAAFFLSDRFESIVPGRARRAGIALLYLLMPNTAEIRGNATNAQWHLGLLAFMIVVSAVPRSRIGKTIDAATLALAGLSGPYSIFLAPLAFIAGRTAPDRWRTVRTAILACCAAIQVAAMLLLNSGGRFASLPMFDIGLLYRILEKQIFVSSLVGPSFSFLNAAPASVTAIVFACMAIAGMAIVAYALFRGPLALKLFLAFAGMNLAASLLAPNIGLPPDASDYATKAWPTLLASSTGSRYWFLPMLGYLLALCWILSRVRRPYAQFAGAVIIGLSLHGFSLELVRPPLPDSRFSIHAARYAAAKSGETVVIPVNPPRWGEMTLTKH